MKPNHERKLKKLIKMWNTHSTAEIAEAIGCTKCTVLHYGKKLREAGLKLPKKHSRGFDYSAFVKSLSTNKE